MVLWVREAATLETADDWASPRVLPKSGEARGSSLGTTSNTSAMRGLGRFPSAWSITWVHTPTALGSRVSVLGAEPISPYTTDAIAWEGRTFTLSKPITCSVTWEEGLWTIDFEPIAAAAHGRTREEAIEAFQEEFVMLWDHYALADDAELAPDALSIKAKLREIAREVPRG